VEKKDQLTRENIAGRGGSRGTVGTIAVVVGVGGVGGINNVRTNNVRTNNVRTNNVRTIGGVGGITNGSSTIAVVGVVGVIGVVDITAVGGSLGTEVLSLVLGINTGRVLVIVQEAEEDVQGSGQDGTTERSISERKKKRRQIQIGC